MTASEYITAVAAAMASDDTLVAWCVSQFGAAPVIYEGYQDEAAALPAISVMTMSGHDRADNQRDITKGLMIGFGIEKSGTETIETTKNVGGTDYTVSRIKHIGFHLAETFREYGENAIFRARIGQSLSIEHAADPDVRPPLFVSYSAVELKELKTTRRRLPGV